MNATSIITHHDIADFAVNKVNLKQDDAREYREQVGRLRDKMAVFVKDHPNTPLIKIRRSTPPYQ